MSEVKVNIRPRFNFDSYAPVQGIVLDEEKAKTIAAVFQWSIINMAAICVSLAGSLLIGWWIHGGFVLATSFVAQKIPSIWLLAKYGLFSS